MATTFEEAKLCPRCQLPGDDNGAIPAKRRGGSAKVHIIFCRNETCRWFNTSWLVQVNADGSIPTPEHQAQERKRFPSMPVIDQQKARDIQAALRADKERQTQRGTEMRNPYA